MTWNRLSDVATALNSLSRAINAAFRGRAQSLPESSFVGDARFILTTNSLTVDFTDNSTAPGSSIVSWSWDFGDGNTSTSQNPTHVYAAAGEYLVGLTVVTASGLVGQTFETVVVAVDDIDQADPVADFATSIAGLTVTFTDASTDTDGTIVDWVWVFGEGVPTANFSSIVTNLSVAFTDTSTDVSPGTIATRAWDFGDGQTSTATNPTHVYAAAGGYNVSLTVTDNEGNTDTKTSTVSVTTGATLGIPFGPYNLWDTSPSSPNIPVAMFSMSQDAYSPSTVTVRINAARALGHKLVAMFTNGSHSNYITKDSSGVSRFDITKWRAKLDTYNTTAIKSAVATAVADGTLLGYDMLDEPQSGSWGPVGHITKAIIDSMATHSQSIFTTLPAGLSVKANYLSGTTYKHVDFITTQYIQAFGDVNTWRDQSISDARPDKVAIVFSINLPNGGAGFSMTTCVPPSGGSSPTDKGRCSMGSAQIKTYGLALGPAGCGMMMWRYVSSIMADSGNSASFRSIAAALAVLPTKTWRSSR